MENPPNLQVGTEHHCSRLNCVCVPPCSPRCLAWVTAINETPPKKGWGEKAIQVSSSNEGGVKIKKDFSSYFHFCSAQWWMEVALLRHGFGIRKLLQRPWLGADQLPISGWNREEITGVFPTDVSQFSLSGGKACLSSPAKTKGVLVAAAAKWKPCNFCHSGSDSAAKTLKNTHSSFIGSAVRAAAVFSCHQAGQSNCQLGLTLWLWI